LNGGVRSGASRIRQWAYILLLYFGIMTLWIRNRWALSLFQAGLFLLALVWLLDWGRERARGRFSFVILPPAAATAWGLLQLALGTTFYRFDTWNAVLYWFTALTVVFLALQLFQQAGDLDFLLRSMLVFGSLLSALSVIQYFTSGGKVFWLFASGFPDAFGPFVYYNNFAAFIELLLPAAVFFSFSDRRNSLAYAALAAVLYACVIASSSRAGAILATLELLVTALLAARRTHAGWSRVGFGFLKITALAAVFVAVVGWQNLLRRFDQADPFVHRRQMLLSSLAMARERPWFGFGLGTFEETYPAFALFDIGLIVNHAHNDWAEWLAEGGVPFLLITASLAVWTAPVAVRSIWGIGLLSVFLHALVDYPMQRLGLAAWVFALVGALAAWKQTQTPSPSP